MRVFRRGNVWWLDYEVRGRRIRESSGSTVKRVAKELLEERTREKVTTGTVRTDVRKVTLGELARDLRNDYVAKENRTLERVEYSLSALGEHFPDEMKAVDVTTAHIRAYIAARLREGRAPATVQRETATLRRMFRLAVEDGKLSHVPHFPSIEVRNTRKGFFRPEDLERVIRELPEYLRPVVRFAALTGWRKSEVLSLTWAQVDFNHGIVRLEPGTTKNDDGREFPFGALAPLDALLCERHEQTRALERARGTIIPFVFHNDGQPIGSIRTAWRGATRRAGVPGALFHDLRRTAVMHLEQAGVSRSVAKALTGHKTDSVFNRYAITPRSALEDGVQKLEKLVVDGKPSRQVRSIR